MVGKHPNYALSPEIFSCASFGYLSADQKVFQLTLNLHYLAIPFDSNWCPKYFCYTLFSPFDSTYQEWGRSYYFWTKFKQEIKLYYISQKSQVNPVCLRWAGLVCSWTICISSVRKPWKWTIWNPECLKRKTQYRGLSLCLISIMQIYLPVRSFSRSQSRHYFQTCPAQQEIHFVLNFFFLYCVAFCNEDRSFLQPNICHCFSAVLYLSMKQ